jgi:flagellar biogenesis protein FliO
MRSILSLKKSKKALAGMACLLVVILLGSIWFGNLAADSGTDQPDEAVTSPADHISTGGMAVRVIGSVALVIGVLYAGMYVMKILSRRAGGNLKKDSITVLQRRYIAPKKAICVVTVGRRAMVVGVTDAQISHLADLSQEDLESITVPDTGKRKDFKQHLLAFGFGMKDKA